MNHDQLRLALRGALESMGDELIAALPADLDRISQVELLVRGKSQELARSILDLWGKAAVRGLRPACPNCSAPMRHKGTRPFHVLTAVGTVRAERPRWRCETCCTESYPHDTSLRFAGHAVSLPLAKIVARLGATLPFDEARDALAELCDVRLSKQSVELITVEVGRRFLQREKTNARQSAEENFENTARPGPSPDDPTPQLVAIIIDSGDVHADGSWLTVRVATVTAFDDELRPTARTTVARALPAEEFGFVVSERAERLNAQTAARRVVISDGSAENWQIAQQHFPDAVQVLGWGYLSDLIHRSAIDLVAEAESAEWAERLLVQFETGSLDAAMQFVRGMAADHLPRRRRRAARELVEFLEHNVERMRYRAFRTQGIPIGDDAVQSVAVVERRCRTPRMRNWRRGAVEAIVAIRAALADGSFESRWNDLQNSPKLSHELPP